MIHTKLIRDNHFMMCLCESTQNAVYLKLIKYCMSTVSPVELEENEGLKNKKNM